MAIAVGWSRSKVFDSLSAVEDTLVTCDLQVIALATLERDKKKVSGLTSFEWIVGICMNAN
jgi:hypothetical protein